MAFPPSMKSGNMPNRFMSKAGGFPGKKKTVPKKKSMPQPKMTNTMGGKNTALSLFTGTPQGSGQ